MNLGKKICSICGCEYEGWGNNAQPLNAYRCCDDCNTDFVLPVRFRMAKVYDLKHRNKET